MIIRVSLALAVTFGLAFMTASAADNIPACTGECLADGECCMLTADRPDMDVPPGWSGSWGGQVRMSEDDYVVDDDMGVVTNSQKATVSGKVCNDGDTLEGPNGVDQTGFGEGDQIEVKFKWELIMYELPSGDPFPPFWRESSPPDDVTKC